LQITIIIAITQEQTVSITITIPRNYVIGCTQLQLQL